MPPPSVSYVQVESLVIMKVVRHVESERNAGVGDLVSQNYQGYLTGMVCPDEGRLEVTNCFPTVKSEVPADDAERNPVTQMKADEDSKVQTEVLQDMLKKFRHMNIDYELAGFYQVHAFGACFTEDLVQALFDYQSSCPDNICLIYDPVKTCQGQLSLKAYRLSQKALDLCYVDWYPETVKKASLTFENMFEELPVHIKNSKLVNVALCEMRLLKTTRPDALPLQIGTSGNLEKCMRQTMTHVDDLNRALSHYSKYLIDKQRYDTIYGSLLQKRQMENEQRRKAGEPLLGLDDIKKQVKPAVLQSKNGMGMMDNFLAAAETKAHVEHTLHVAGESLSKIFIAENLVDDRPPKERTSLSVTHDTRR